jgi:hypothetical protein
MAMFEQSLVGHHRVGGEARTELNALVNKHGHAASPPPSL